MVYEALTTESAKIGLKVADALQAKYEAALNGCRVVAYIIHMWRHLRKVMFEKPGCPTVLAQSQSSMATHTATYVSVPDTYLNKVMTIVVHNHIIDAEV